MTFLHVQDMDIRIVSYMSTKIFVLKFGSGLTLDLFSTLVEQVRSLASMLAKLRDLAALTL
jgi:hypothetical protein